MHYASRIVSRGLDNSIQLKITSSEEVQKYRKKLQKASELADKTSSRKAHAAEATSRSAATAPWTDIRVIDGTPVFAHLDPEGKKGSVRIKLIGRLPGDLVLYVSENH